MISAADRAATVCANIERIFFGKRLFLDRDEFFPRSSEKIICEALIEHEIDVRRAGEGE